MGLLGDAYDTVAGAADHAAGSTDEAVARTFDDEPGGGIGEGLGEEFGSSKTSFLTSGLQDLGVVGTPPADNIEEPASHSEYVAAAESEEERQQRQQEVHSGPWLRDGPDFSHQGGPSNDALGGSGDGGGLDLGGVPDNPLVLLGVLLLAAYMLGQLVDVGVGY